MLQIQVRSKKVRVGDKVVVRAGNCKGQVGTIAACLGNRVIVQGINIRKKAVRRSEQNPKGGIIEMEHPMHISNVTPCDADGMPLKLRMKPDAAGKKLTYEKDGKRIEYRSVKHSDTYKSKKGG